jgi:anti-anti-sigma regulatory factor
MAIQIKIIAGVYVINGEFNSQNNKSLKSYFEILLNQTNILLISINKNVKITSNGLKTMGELYNSAFLRKKKFRIVNVKSKQTLKKFKMANLMHLIL